MLNYKDYVKYWYDHGFKGWPTTEDCINRLKDSCVLSPRFNKYVYYDEKLRQDLSHYKTSICVLVGIFSRMKNEDKLLNY